MTTEEKKEYTKELGERLVVVREEKNLTREDLAADFGVGKEQIYKIESNRSTIHPVYIYILAEKYGINPSWIITGKGSKYFSDEFIKSQIQDLEKERQKIEAKIQSLKNNMG